MSFDNSRFTFNPRNNYSGVVMEQGRVQLDSDWNEWLAELNRRIQAGTLDMLGGAVYPATTPYAFQITATTSGGTNQLMIGPGRMYVDGLLAENHGDPSASVWDSALEELSGSPQPPPATEGGAIRYTEQPYLPGATIPAGGPFLAYLDVWVRPVTYIEDPNLIDKAVGVDTTGRLQTVWQVKLMPAPQGSTWTCSTPVPWPQSSGLLTTAAVPSAASGPCCLSDGTGYTGMENQFYRVEIHQPGSATAGGATFKWSRDNASVMTGVTAIASVTDSAGNPASALTVVSLGRDQVLGFKPGDWIEVLDDALELNGEPGELCQIDTVDFSARTLTLTTTLSVSFPLVAGGNQTDPASHVRIRRWDQAGKVYEIDGTTVWADLGAATSTGDIPVPPAGTTLILEDGVTISFDESPAGGSFLTGDFWTFAARTADGSVEALTKAPPRGIHHHYARLSIVDFSVPSATDCRTKWPPSSGEECGCCCTCTVGDGVESFGAFTSIQKAIDSLPASGGEVCILPGRYFENVFIENRKDVVVHGCGWQTRIASAALQPALPPPVPSIVAAPGLASNPTGAAAGAAGSAAGTTATTFAAVITVAGCQHIELRSFAVEAATGEVGILLDGAGALAATPPTAAPQTPSGNANNTLRDVVITNLRGVTDVTIKDLILTASTRPAILAQRVRLLRIDENRIAMANVPSMWPAVWVSGAEIHIDHNWVGIQSAANNVEWLPASVAADLSADASASASSGTNSVGTNAAAFVNVSKVALHPGGIQIAGPSQDVFITENEIEGGRRNGITLGSFTILDANGNDTGATTGVVVVEPGPCDTTTTTLEPGSPASGSTGTQVVAGGRLLRILIARNRIRNMGLCGIGPVGFFNLLQTLEIITIEDLNISSNAISSTLLSALAVASETVSVFGYGAICIPDVLNLIIRDNTITDFGATPGLEVCGIFILHGEMVEISRNHVIETRDWAEDSTDVQKSASGVRAGIMILLVEPPTLTASYSTSPWAPASPTGASLSNASGTIFSPVYQPGLPALRIEHNIVRVPLGETLAVLGFGPFSIVNNHFGCGGTIRATGTPIAQTVLIMNLGKAIESVATAGTFTGQYASAGASYTHVNAAAVASPSSGGVLFTNNVCQLEERASRQRAFSSVLILSLDQLLFNSNHCWIDGPERSVTIDAALLAGSTQVTSNRFQEAIGSVLASGLTFGVLNISTQNLSTYCLLVDGTLTRNTDNLAAITLTNPKACSAQ
jgi:Family of unknown function (DUF6519)